MYKFIIIVILSSLNLFSNAQSILATKIPAYGKTIKSFIPKGWIVLATATGDYNNDGIKDYALVIVDSFEEKMSGDVSRSIIILKGEKNGFQMSGSCDSAVLCWNCGGIHGDPFLAIKFDNNKLIVSHYGGSSWKWKLTDKFRFKNDRWTLIGATTDYYHSIEYCEKLKDYEGKDFKTVNYLTGESHFVKISKCSIVLNKKEKSKIKSLTELEYYNVNRQGSLWDTP